VVTLALKVGAAWRQAVQARVRRPPLSGRPAARRVFAGADDPADAAALARLLAPAGATPARLDHWLGWALLGVLRAVGAAPPGRHLSPPKPVRPCLAVKGLLGWGRVAPPRVS